MCFHRQTNSNHEQILHNLTVGGDRHLSGKGLSKDHKIVVFLETKSCDQGSNIENHEPERQRCIFVMGNHHKNKAEYQS